MSFKAECRCTAIGSFPHLDAASAMDDISTFLKDIPVWPQLPSRSFLEGMCPQYSEGIPAAVLDLENERISVDTGPSLTGAMEKFYEKYLDNDITGLAISSGSAPGLFEFEKRMRESEEKRFAVKGHITGPITWGLTVCDAGGRAAYYNDMLKDGVVKGLAGKARWQVEFLSKLNPNVIVFVDEPYLQSFGSAAVPLLAEDVVWSLDEVIDSIQASEAVAGIHCCGNTDWSLLCDTRTDIINFDAFQYAQALSLYSSNIGDFLERGGTLAWGIVPSTNEIDQNSLDTLMETLRWGIGLLTKKGLRESKILEQSLITPSCGAGSLSLDRCRRMLDLTKRISDVLRGNGKPA